MFFYLLITVIVMGALIVLWCRYFETPLPPKETPVSRVSISSYTTENDAMFEELDQLDVS